MIKYEKKYFILSFCLKSVHLSLYLRVEDFVTNTVIECMTYF